MYITLQSVSKNLGFKGLEIKDLIIGIPLLLLFIILFCFIKVYFIAISQLLISAFLLLPINVSKKNTEIELKFNGTENSEMYLEFLKLNFEGKGKNYNKSNRPLLYIKTDNVTKKLEHHDSEYQFYNGRKDYTINLGYYKDKKNSIKI